MTYDEMILRGPEHERRDVGTDDGEDCGRIQEPDCGVPRGYKPKPCNGVMVRWVEPDGFDEVECDTCGSIV